MSMDRLKISGKKRLNGSVAVSGAKNAALPILIASLLSEKKSRFEKVPKLEDITTTIKVLEHLGIQSQWTASNSLTLDAAKITTQDAPYDLVRKMRASVLVLGPLVARFGYAKVSLPGGCAIGARPINYHLSGIEKLGAKIELESGYVIARADKLKGARINLPFPSVGATENLMMAAALAQGETLIENAAREPEIVDLAVALRSMGLEIEGEGSETIRIQGKNALNGIDHAIMSDRIEAGTFLAAAVATQGDVTISNIQPEHIESALVLLEDAGASIERKAGSVRARMTGRPKPIEIKTLPYPGFPTDMQAQFMAFLTLASGTSLITETIFENRFMHVPELVRLGANITIRGNTAVVVGVDDLIGAPVMATDLRASASLVIAALAASGESVINRIYHLDRGYEKIEEKLKLLGADIERQKD